MQVYSSFSFLLIISSFSRAVKAMSNLIINKQDYNFNGELFPPKIQCPNKFKKCPCLSHE